jgi:hypothetical protein
MLLFNIAKCRCGRRVIQSAVDSGNEILWTHFAFVSKFRHENYEEHRAITICAVHDINENHCLRRVRKFTTNFAKTAFTNLSMTALALSFRSIVEDMDGCVNRLIQARSDKK